MALEHVYGWWSFDREAQALVREDGVAVVFEGFADELGRTPFVRWMRFRLKAPRGSLPLLVERRDYPARFSSPLVWRADMRRSFEAIEAYPESRDEWLSVRDSVLDGLGCWPDGTDAGVRPGQVAIDGRWSGGRWTGDHYLLRAATEIQHKHMKPQRAGDPGPEQAWAFVPPSDAPPAARVDELYRASARVLGNAIADLIERGPCLLSDDRAILPFYLLSSCGSPKIRLLYVDEEIVTDRLWLSASALGADPMRWSVSFEQDCVIGTRWRDGMRPVDFGRFGRTERSSQQTENGTREWARFPPEFIARMAESFADGLPVARLHLRHRGCGERGRRDRHSGAGAAAAERNGAGRRNERDARPRGRARPVAAGLCARVRARRRAIGQAGDRDPALRPCNDEDERGRGAAIARVRGDPFGIVRRGGRSADAPAVRGR
jgi:hypothetical protein